MIGKPERATARSNTWLKKPLVDGASIRVGEDKLLLRANGLERHPLLLLASLPSLQDREGPGANDTPHSAAGPPSLADLRPPAVGRWLKCA
jgi:hypothetical protein